VSRKRSTGCVSPHYGGACRKCATLRKRRERQRKRMALAAELKHADPLQREQLLAEREAARAAAAARNPELVTLRRAIAYVHRYKKRGAIVPPDACERCERPVQIFVGGRSEPLVFWHPNPARVREVAWLCRTCRIIIRSTREPLTLSWTWPGLAAPRARGPLPLGDPEAHAYGLRVMEPLGTIASTQTRLVAYIGAYLSKLPIGKREQLYAAGNRGGASWAPTGDRGLDAAWREWFLQERADRGRAARARGGLVVEPIPARERRRRGLQGSSHDVDRPVGREIDRPPFDEEANHRRIHAAIRRLDEADEAADAINRRVGSALSVHDLGPRARLRGRPVERDDREQSEESQ
jgi:hypothetical protein